MFQKIGKVMTKRTGEICKSVSAHGEPGASAKSGADAATIAKPAMASAILSNKCSHGIAKNASQEKAQAKAPVVGIIMGSKSDAPAMEACMKQLDDFGVLYEVKIASAHRSPDEVHAWAASAHERGIKVIIAAAGKAAHLGGVVAAYTPCPVIAVPMKTSDLGGLDSLLSMVQMPSGVPVACVAINGAKNAAILAVQMMGTNCEKCRQKIIDFKANMAGA